MEDVISLALVLSFAVISLPLVSQQLYYSGVEAERRRNGTPAERIGQMERDARRLRETSRFMKMMSEVYPNRRAIYREAYYQNELKRFELRNQAFNARLNHLKGS